MYYGFSEEQLMLQKTVASMLKQEMPLDKARQIFEQEGGFSKKEWKKIAEGGWLALQANADADAFSLVDMMYICGAFGTYLFPGPFALVAGFLVPMLSKLPLNHAQKDLLEGLLSGDLLATAVIPKLEKSQYGLRWNLDGVQVESETDEKVVLNGMVQGVMFLPFADVVGVPVKNPYGGLATILLRMDTQGVEIQVEHHLDLSKPLGTLSIQHAVVDKQDDIIGQWEEDLYQKWIHQLAVYTICLNGEMLGGATAVLERTVNYVKERRQFGVPVGSFQAVKHMLADMYTAIENSRSFDNYVAWQYEYNPRSILNQIACSKLYTSSVYKKVCEQAIQLHGGMGFTWEEGIHFWYKASLFHLYHLADPIVLNQFVLKEMVRA